MEITEVGLFVTLVYARHKQGSVKQVIEVLARPEKEGGLGLLEDEDKSKDKVWRNVEKDISVWPASVPQVREVELLHLSFELSPKQRRDWSMAQNELKRAMAGLTSPPVGRTLLYLAALSDRSKLDEGLIALKAAQIGATHGQALTSILALSEVARSRLYLLSSASEGQDMVYLALQREQGRQKVSQKPFFVTFTALSWADTIAHQFYSLAHKYLSDGSRERLHQATTALMTNAIEMLQQEGSSDLSRGTRDSTTLSQLNAQVASLVKMTASLRALDSKLERLQLTYDSYLKGKQGLASLLAYHRQQMNDFYLEIEAELKEANLALETANRAMSTLHLKYDRLPAFEGQRQSQIEKVRALDAERAMKEQTEAIRQQTLVIQELLQGEKERAAQEARAAQEQAQLEKERLEQEARAARKQAQLERERSQQELRTTQEQVRHGEEQALEELRAIEKQTLFLQKQIVALKQQTLSMKQQTLATKQQIRLAQELALQEARSAKLTQSILVVLGVAFIVGQIVGGEPTLIFLRGFVIIGTALLTTLLVYLLGGARQASEEPLSLPSESEEFSNAPLRLPPSDDSPYR